MSQCPSTGLARPLLLLPQPPPCPKPPRNHTGTVCHGGPRAAVAGAEGTPGAAWCPPGHREPLCQEDDTAPHLQHHGVHAACTEGRVGRAPGQRGWPQPPLGSTYLGGPCRTPRPPAPRPATPAGALRTPTPLYCADRSRRAAGWAPPGSPGAPRAGPGVARRGREERAGGSLPKGSPRRQRRSPQALPVSAVDVEQDRESCEHGPG